MKLLSIQSKEVLQKVLEEGVCYPDISKADQRLTQLHAYKDYMQRYGEEIPKRTGMKFSNKIETVFWGYSHFEGIGLELDNPAALDRALEMIGTSNEQINNGDKVIMELDVPDQLILKTNFYTYTDMLFTCEEEDGYYYNKEKMFIVDENEDTQGIFMCIRKEYLIRYVTEFKNSMQHEMMRMLTGIRATIRQEPIPDNGYITSLQMRRIHYATSYMTELKEMANLLPDSTFKCKLINAIKYVFRSTPQTITKSIDSLIKIVTESNDEDFTKIILEITTQK